jgi:hypothetical protein
LAGVSPEWYTWLEQGRDIHVSGQVLESLVRVLQLDADERAHVFLLALGQPPPIEMFSPPTVSPTLQQFIDQLGAIPAGVVDARMNVVAWNAAYCAVFGDFATTPERERNIIWRLFTSPLMQEGSKGWEKLASVFLAQFRAGYARFIKDPWWARQIAELSQVSPMFRELWARHDVINVSEGKKVMHHPLAGKLAFDFLFLQAGNASDLRLIISTPQRDSGTAEKIERLLADRSLNSPTQA